MGHSSSAYSLELVSPIGKVMTARTKTNCQPQKVNDASLSLNNLTFEVRCTTYNEVANKAHPPKANITELVCKGLSLEKVNHGVSKFLALIHI